MGLSTVTARFRFYAELNDFLPPVRRARTFSHDFLDLATVKDRIESFGVPHTEVDLILANGESVDFTYVVRDGDFVSVWSRQATDGSGWNVYGQRYNALGTDFVFLNKFSQYPF
jgi:hypothetical protein